MKCPCCGAVFDSSQQAYQRRMIAQGRCAHCGKRKAPADEPYWWCRGCRLAAGARARARYRRQHPNTAREVA